MHDSDSDEDLQLLDLDEDVKVSRPVPVFIKSIKMEYNNGSDSDDLLNVDDEIFNPSKVEAKDEDKVIVKSEKNDPRIEMIKMETKVELYFRKVLPFGFYLRLMEQILEGQITMNDVVNIYQDCEANPQLLHLLVNLASNIHEEPNFNPCVVPCPPSFKIPQVLLTCLPSMSPAAVFVYFNHIRSLPCVRSAISNVPVKVEKTVSPKNWTSSPKTVPTKVQPYQPPPKPNRGRGRRVRSGSPVEPNWRRGRRGRYGSRVEPNWGRGRRGRYGSRVEPKAETLRRRRGRAFTASSYGSWASASGVNSEMEMDTEQKPEFEEEEQEEIEVTETYQDYKPAKLKYGEKHPDAIVETASLASVQPPDCYYKLSLPPHVIKDGLLSALQLESIVYASQLHEHFLPSNERAGFLIGDGAGVGKGRTLAGIIYENYLCKRRKAIWISVSNDLVYDSERDLHDIGAKHIKLNPLSKLKYGKIENFNTGVLFVTYSGLIGKSCKKVKNNTRLKQIIEWCGGEDFDGVLVFDESHRAKNLIPPSGNSKLKPTKTGVAVQELQCSLPKARVVYASATGASEPRHMAYMSRLGLWGESTPFPTVNDFVQGLNSRGVGAMELVAMDMKLRGAYIARQLSFKGVKFTIVDVPLPRGFEEIYNKSVEFWATMMSQFKEGILLMNYNRKEEVRVWTNFWGAHQRFFKYLCIASKVNHTVSETRMAVAEGFCVVIGLQGTGEARTLEQLEKDEGDLTEFVSTAKGVLQHLVEHSFPVPENEKLSTNSIPTVLDEVKENNLSPEGSVGRKKVPVRKAAQKLVAKMNTVSDDENSEVEFALDEAESDLDLCEPTDDEEEPSLSVGGLRGGKRKVPLPLTQKQYKRTKFSKSLGKNQVIVSKAAAAAAVKIRDILLAEIELLGEELPPNTLDALIDELGGPTKVAEMTGRKGRVVQDDQGSVLYESRAEDDISLKMINVEEKERFMNGEKFIAIISEAASSGISLQSDRRVTNKRKRVHITLELPWSADRAIQQFGRTHRSNQIQPPEYIFLTSNIAGEYRFASIVAKRLESLGALTHGDRRAATESRDLSRYNVDNKFGRQALGTVIRSIMRQEDPIVSPPAGYVNAGAFYDEIKEAFHDVGLGDSTPEEINLKKFLNRILGMKIQTQNSLFEYFTSTLAEVVKRAKRSGRWDLGIVDLADGDMRDVTLLDAKSYDRKHSTGTGIIQLHKISVNRGLNWEEAERKLNARELTAEEGFYCSTRDIDGRRQCQLVLRDYQTTTTRTKFYMVYKPHIGLQPKRDIISDILMNYGKVDVGTAKKFWEAQYECTESSCNHLYWGRYCGSTRAGISCEFGIRKRIVHILSGSVLLVWGEVEQILKHSSYRTEVKMQVIRVRGNNCQIIGVLIPNNSVEEITDVLITGNVVAMDVDRGLD